jgi:hypothetical protein
MAKMKVNTPNKQTPRQQSRLIWFGAGAAVILFIVISFVVSRAAQLPFELAGGETSPLVLLGNDTMVDYEFTYLGEQPITLVRLRPHINLSRDQVLVADIRQVFVEVGGEQVELAGDGFIPDGTEIILQPGDLLKISLVYFGQELGWNQIAGFPVQYEQNGRTIEGELDLMGEYYVFVE